MSNRNLSPTPGLHRIEPDEPRDYAVAAKVTGRTLAAVSYIVALEAERMGEARELSAVFGTDGSLQEIKVYQEHGNVTIPPGFYLVLEPNSPEAVIVTEQAYRTYYRRVDA